MPVQAMLAWLVPLLVPRYFALSHTSRLCCLRSRACLKRKSPVCWFVLATLCMAGHLGFFPATYRAVARVHPRQICHVHQGLKQSMRWAQNKVQQAFDAGVGTSDGYRCICACSRLGSITACPCSIRCSRRFWFLMLHCASTNSWAGSAPALPCSRIRCALLQQMFRPAQRLWLNLPFITLHDKAMRPQITN